MWTSLAENDLAGTLKGVLMWSGNLRASIGGAGLTRIRVIAHPVPKAQPGAD